MPYTIEADGRVMNQVRVKITNRSAHDAAYRIAVTGVDSAQAIIPVNPFPVAKGATEMTSIFFMTSAASFHDGARPITIRLSDGGGFNGEFPYRLLGPQEEHEGEHEHEGRR